MTSGSVTLTRSTVSDNSTAGSSGDGGGIRSSSGDVTLNSSTISGNTTNRFGGGVYTVNGVVSLTNSTLSDNLATGTSGGGGGIFNFLGEVSLINSTVTGNETGGDGGGIYVLRDSLDPSFTIENSIVSGNIAGGTSPDLHFDPDGAVAINFSLIGDTSGSGITTATGFRNVLNQPALLGPLSDNGGPTQTHALLEGSPAIDAGSNALAVDENGNPLTTDQRGEARIESGTVDIGAVEFGDPFLLGDVNRDRAVTFLDISPFISLLASSAFQDEADIDDDGFVTFLDISPFITLLSSVGSAQVSSSVAAPAVSSELSVSAEAIAIEPLVGSEAPLVLVAEQEPVVSVVSTVKVPITKTPLVETTAAKPATVSPKIALKISQPPLVLTNNSTASQMIEANQPPVLDTSAVGASPVDTYIGPVAIVPASYRIVGDRDTSLRVSESDDQLVTRRSLEISSERIDLPSGSLDVHSSVNVSQEDSVSTTAEFFDAHPETLDDVFDFELEEMLAGLI